MICELKKSETGIVLTVLNIQSSGKLRYQELHRKLTECSKTVYHLPDRSLPLEKIIDAHPDGYMGEV